MKSSPGSFWPRARLFVAVVIISTLAACTSEKKVASAIQTTDTVAKTVASEIPPTDSGPPITAPAETASKAVPDSAHVPTYRGVSVRLVDTTETEQYRALKVEVSLAGRVDTIPGVLTFDTPVMTPDGALHGPNYTMDGEYAGIYSYDPRRRALSQIRLPADAARWDSEVKLSPDASHIAYIGGDSAGARGIVRSWPTAAIVLETGQAPTPPGDYSFNQVWWASRDSVEFSWRVDLGPKKRPPEHRFAFVVVYAPLAARRFAVDTLFEQPRLRNYEKR
jgi:hypothetical protein